MSRSILGSTWGACAALLAALALASCKADVAPGSPTLGGRPVLAIRPVNPYVAVNTEASLTATLDGAPVAVRWTLEAGTAGGTLVPDGGSPATRAVYAAAAQTGADTVRAFDPTTVQTVSTTVTVIAQQPPDGHDPPGGARFAALVAPVDGETFTGPSVDLRFVGVGHDASSSNQLAADQLELLVDGTTVLTVPTTACSSTLSLGPCREFWVFKGYATALALSPGDHAVVARATFSNPPATLDSRQITIHVEAPPAYARTVSLSGDQTVAQLGNLVGTSGGRIRVNGNGYRIRDAGAAAVNWQYVDFHDLGSRADTSANGIDVTAAGDITVQSCRFDSSNPTRLALGSASAATIRGNTWRSNVRQPIGQGSDGAGGSFAAVVLTGKSSARSVFAGNNVGAGWVDLDDTQHWTVGGDADADANVLVGPRVGLFVDWQGAARSSDITLRRNYSNHIYMGGWSQGSNYELRGIASVTAEHNVIASGSWTVRGAGGQLRYNLVFPGGEGWVWVDPGARIHHNVFVGGGRDRTGIYNVYGHPDVEIRNNTFDGRGETYSGWTVIGTTGSEIVDSNVFYRWPSFGSGNVVRWTGGGSVTADHNLFHQCASPYYWDARAPAGDVTGDPLFARPANATFTWDERAVWERTLSPGAILAAYRTRYTPGTGSPAIDHGDTATFGAGNDIGAVGAGASNAHDQFGK